jgi:ABC-type lipoprotein release transport system permease subunit
MAIAISCSVLLAKMLRSQLFGVSTSDPLTLIVVVLLIAGVALVAAILPTWRASAVNPTTALRTE